VLTNWHVVAGIDPAALTVNPAGGEVELFDHTQRQRTGTVVAADPRLDLAVVAVDDFSDLPALPLAEDSPPVGTGVWAFGAPFGIVGTMTAGRVTGVDVNTTFAQTTVQSALLMTDATVNPGNSGGPLVTADGTVAGLITLRPDEAGDRAVQGLAFALPADAVAWAAEALADGKQPPYVAVGFEGRSTTADDRLDRGVEVTRVVDGMPAADAGMVADDVIVAFDGQDIDRFEMLVEQLRYYRPGDRVTVTVDRDGVQQQLSLQLAARPDDF